MARCNSYADLPTDAVPPAKTQAATDCCRLTHPFIGSITRRAGHDLVADGKNILQCLGLANAAEGEIVPQAKGEPGQWIEDEAHV